MKQNLQKNKVVTGKTLIFVIVLPILFVLTLARDRTVLYGQFCIAILNVVFSILILSIKNR